MTDPTPMAALRALADKWRDIARDQDIVIDTKELSEAEHNWHAARSQQAEDCADQLEATIEALATPGAGVVDMSEVRRQVHSEITAFQSHCATPAPVAVESDWVLTMRSGVAAMNDNVIGTFNDYATAIAVGGMLYDADKMNHPEYRTFDVTPAPEAAAQVSDAMVERAMEAHADEMDRQDTAESLPLMGRLRECMRAALTAALRPNASTGEG